jgi:hypothetical protein
MNHPLHSSYFSKVLFLNLSSTGSVKILISAGNSLPFPTGYGHDPSPRGRGRQPKENIPLTPVFQSSLFFGFFGSVEILMYPAIRLYSSVIMRVTPSLPQRGKQREGEHPFDPRGIFTNLLWVYPCVGDAQAAGAEASDAVAPKSGL